MPEQEKSSKSYDPFEPFRAMRDAYLESMARTMVEAVNTEAYAQATGAMLEGYLTAAAPFREAMEKSMSQTLQQLSLPSRQEVAVLAERFTNVEMRLDDMDAKLDRIEKLLQVEKPHESAPKSAGTEVPATTAAAHTAHAAETEASAQPGMTSRRGAHGTQR